MISNSKLSYLERSTLDKNHTLNQDNPYINGKMGCENINKFKSVLDKVGFYHFSNQKNQPVPNEFLEDNCAEYFSNTGAIDLVDNTIRVGDYNDKGVIIPRNYGQIVFDQLFNCPPLISLVKGPFDDYIAFLHVGAGTKNKTVDKQVKHWMNFLSKKGEVSETIFAPRKRTKLKEDKDYDTMYKHSLKYLKKYSKSTTVFARDMGHLKGVANSEGVFFENCGYLPWKS